ncbi:MAG: DNA translocase FtsK [Candidatus Aquidulcis sp.]|nr:MAG: DNA translocase FtsK [Candidatus Aquidulcis sp.]
MAKRGGESTSRQARRGPLASRSALRTLLSLAFAVTGVIFAVGLILPGRGALADVLRDVLAPWFGAGRWLIPALLIGFAIWIERRASTASRVPLRIGLSLLALVGLLAIVEIVFPTHGGRIGSIAGGGAASLLTGIGAFVAWVGILTGVGLILAEATVRKMFATLFAGAKVGAEVIGDSVERLAAERERIMEEREATRVAEAARIAASAASTPVINVSSASAEPDPLPPTEPNPAPSGASVRSGGSVRESGDGSTAPNGAPAIAASGGGMVAWKLPSTQLLDAPGKAVSPNASIHQANAGIIVQKLRDLGIEIISVTANPGPVVTQYELTPAPNVRISRIEGLGDDLAMALSARSIRIEAPIPGKAVVGIEIPNQEAEAIRFKPLLTPIDAAGAWVPTQIIPFALGKDVGGAPQTRDLASMPHLLIAGATGSGKSVMVNAIIASFLFARTPQELRMILVDPKRVELSGYNGLPHLLVPVITESDKAASALKWAVLEMESRYRMFASAGARNLEGYNASREDVHDRMYSIVIIIDELADLMMQDGRETEESIVRIAQKARATGIHLILATQRPSVNVVTGLIKANIPSRIAFSMASQIDSRTVLDAPGAEDLIGRGDMLFQPSDAPKPTRMQGVFVSDREINAVVTHWRDQGLPDYQLGIVAATERNGGGGVDRGRDEEPADRLFDEAVQVVAEHDRASASLLQRRLRIGYARAARIIDQLEEKGYIGSFDGSTARVVNRDKIAADASTTNSESVTGANGAGEPGEES